MEDHPDLLNSNSIKIPDRSLQLGRHTLKSATRYCLKVFHENTLVSKVVYLNLLSLSCQQLVEHLK